MKFPFQDLNDGKTDYCQISGKKNLVEFIDLGSQPLSDTLIERKNLEEKEKFFELKILRSPTLGHTQLSYIVPQKELYHLDYPYRPGITSSIVEHHNHQSKKNIQKFKIKKNELVVDVGSNDGTLLHAYKSNDMKVLGIEPTNMAKVANDDGIETIQSVFNFEIARNVRQKYGSAKLITATNVFAHMATLGSVMEGIMELLDDEGFFIIENHNMLDIVKHNQYDTFYHEHIRNYSFISLKYLFEMYGLKIVDVEVVERYNGSIRVAVTKNKNFPEIVDIENEIKKEIEFGLLKDEVWTEFKSKIEKSKKNLVDLLKQINSSGKRVVGNSCPARCSTLLNYCDIGTELIPYIAEQPTSFKLNKYLPGKRIPIVNNDILFKEQPDYVLLLAWHLREPIIKKLKSLGLKSKFIIPLPEVKII